MCEFTHSHVICKMHSFSRVCVDFSINFRNYSLDECIKNAQPYSPASHQLKYSVSLMIIMCSIGTSSHQSFAWPDHQQFSIQHAFEWHMRCHSWMWNIFKVGTIHTCFYRWKFMSLSDSISFLCSNKFTIDTQVILPTAREKKIGTHLPQPKSINSYCEWFLIPVPCSPISSFPSTASWHNASIGIQRAHTHTYKHDKLLRIIKTLAVTFKIYISIHIA